MQLGSRREGRRMVKALTLNLQHRYFLSLSLPLTIIKPIMEDNVDVSFVFRRAVVRCSPGMQYQGCSR